VNPAAAPPVSQEAGRRDGNATITASRLRAATYQALSVRRARRAARQPLAGRLGTARHGAQHARPFRHNRPGIKQRAPSMPRPTIARRVKRRRDGGLFVRGVVQSANEAMDRDVVNSGDTLHITLFAPTARGDCPAASRDAGSRERSGGQDATCNLSIARGQRRPTELGNM
jgi:hypothetical protein